MNLPTITAKPWRIEQCYQGSSWSLYHTFKGDETEAQRTAKLALLTICFPNHSFRLVR